MEGAILSNCRRLIRKQDTVYLLGDLASSKEGVNLVQSIKGIKKIVWGNHDLLSLKLYQEHFPDTQFRMWYKVKNVILSHVPVHPQELEYQGTFPHSTPPRYNIHGHVHKFTIADNRYFNASVDVNGWGPVKLEDILSDWDLPS
jgi:calcineurin-like phosphoesterase family protein